MMAATPALQATSSCDPVQISEHKARPGAARATDGADELAALDERHAAA
jgi:hypothetical protein